MLPKNQPKQLAYGALAPLQSASRTMRGRRLIKLIYCAVFLHFSQAQRRHQRTAHIAMNRSASAKNLRRLLSRRTEQARFSGIGGGSFGATAKRTRQAGRLLRMLLRPLWRCVRGAWRCAVGSCCGAGASAAGGCLLGGAAHARKTGTAALVPVGHPIRRGQVWVSMEEWTGLYALHKEDILAARKSRFEKLQHRGERYLARMKKNSWCCCCSAKAKSKKSELARTRWRKWIAVSKVMNILGDFMSSEREREKLMREEDRYFTGTSSFGVEWCMKQCCGGVDFPANWVFGS